MLERPFAKNLYKNECNGIYTPGYSCAKVSDQDHMYYSLKHEGEEILFMDYDKQFMTMDVEISDVCPFTKEMLESLTNIPLFDESPRITDVLPDRFLLIVGTAELMIQEPEKAEEILSVVLKFIDAWDELEAAHYDYFAALKGKFPYVLTRERPLEDCYNEFLLGHGDPYFNYEVSVFLDTCVDFFETQGYPHTEESREQLLKNLQDNLDAFYDATPGRTGRRQGDISFTFDETDTLVITELKPHFNSDTDIECERLRIKESGMVEMTVQRNFEFPDHRHQILDSYELIGWQLHKNFPDKETELAFQCVVNRVLLENALSFVATDLDWKRKDIFMSPRDDDFDKAVDFVHSRFFIPGSRWVDGYLEQHVDPIPTINLLIAAPELASTVKLALENALAISESVKIPNHTKPRRENESEEVNQTAKDVLRWLIGKTEKIMEDPEYRFTLGDNRLLEGEDASRMYEEGILPEDLTPEQEQTEIGE